MHIRSHSITQFISKLQGKNEGAIVIHPSPSATTHMIEVNTVPTCPTQRYIKEDKFVNKCPVRSLHTTDEQ